MQELLQKADELSQAGRWFYQKGMLPATSGNLSAKLSDGSIAITVSGSDKGCLHESDVMRVDSQGRALDGRTPSAEVLLHTQLYQRISNAAVVLHLHSLASTVLSRLGFALKSGSESAALQLQDYELLKVFPSIETHKISITVPIFANNQNIMELAAEVDRHLSSSKQCYGYLIAGHGFYTWGESMAEARKYAEAFDFLFQCELRCREGLQT